MLQSESSDETNGDRQALIEAFVQALKSFVERLSRVETPTKSGPEHNSEENPFS